jgi:tetratricopeptide (TPR) repeat protein
MRPIIQPAANNAHQKNLIITRAGSKLQSRVGTAITCVCLSLMALSMSSCAAELKPATSHPATAVPKLTSDFIYKYLVGEVAGQRGDLATSGSIFYDLARENRDPRLAERAAKIAAQANMGSLAMPAAKLWSELDPASTEAQQAVTEIMIATGKISAAEPYLAKLLQKEETRAGGFLYLNVLLSRNPDKAGTLRLVQSLAKPYPKMAEAQFAIGQAAWSAGQNDLALASLEQAGKLKPGWHIAALLQGQILFDKSPQASLEFHQRYLNQYPDANDIRINLVKLLVSQKQYAAAKKQYPLILKNANNSPEVTAVVGLLAFQSSDYAAAEGYFTQALAADFKDVDQIYLYLGLSAEKQQHDEAALNWYHKVLPGQRYLEAQLNIANVIARTQSVDIAIEKLDALEDLNTEQQILVIQSQAVLLSKAKRHQDAFDLLGKAVQNLPNTPDLIYDYALAAERILNFEVMVAELRKVMQAKPDFAAAYNALGYSYADRNIKLDEAISLIEKALSITPNDHFALDSLGWAHYRKGNLDKAIAYLQQAYASSADPEIAAHLGEALWQKGQREAALNLWRDALTANPGNEVLLAVSNKFKL